MHCGCLLCSGPQLIVHPWFHIILIRLSTLRPSHIRALVVHVLVHAHTSTIWVWVWIREIGGRRRGHVGRWRLPARGAEVRTAACATRLTLFHVCWWFKDGWWLCVAGWVRGWSHAIRESIGCRSGWVGVKLVAKMAWKRGVGQVGVFSRMARDSTHGWAYLGIRRCCKMSLTWRRSGHGRASVRK